MLLLKKSWQFWLRLPAQPPFGVPLDRAESKSISHQTQAWLVEFTGVLSQPSIRVRAVVLVRVSLRETVRYQGSDVMLTGTTADAFTGALTSYRGVMQAAFDGAVVLEPCANVESARIARVAKLSKIFGMFSKATSIQDDVLGSPSR